MGFSTVFLSLLNFIHACAGLLCSFDYALLMSCLSALYDFGRGFLNQCNRNPCAIA